MCSPFCTLPAKASDRTPSEELSGPVPRWRGWHIVALLALWAAIYIPGMIRPALLDDADSTHAEAAREMVLRHDWVTMYMNGIRYMEKAPLMYWGMAGSIELFGVKDWAVRLPLALSVLALVFVIYAFGRRAFRDANAGFFGALATVAALGPYIFTRFLIPDIIVGLWLALGCMFFLETLEQERPSRALCWGIAITAALDVLTKGLIGIAFPCGIILFYLLITRGWRHLRKLRLVSSTLVFLAVAVPWHVLAAVRNPAAGQAKGFLWFYFVNEQVLRFLNKRFPHDYATIPLGIFWGLILVWVFPWTTFLPQALREVRVRGAQALDRRGRANLVLLLWALIIPVFFSFSTRQEYYVIPSIPAFSLLIGGWLGREAAYGSAERLRRWGRISAAVLFAIGMAAFVASLLLVREARPPAPGYDLADLLAKHPQDYSMSLGHLLDLTPEALGAFHGLILGVGISLLVGSGLAWLLRRRSAITASNVTLAATAVALLVCVHMAFIRFSPVLSSHDLAMAVKQRIEPGDILEAYGEYEGASTMNYYTGHILRIYNPGQTMNLWYGSLFPDAPQVLDDAAAFEKIWNGPRRVFLWTYTDKLPPLLKSGQGAPAYVLARRGGKEILCNRPL